MFKIAETQDHHRTPFHALSMREPTGRQEAINKHCITEEWSANLDDGRIRLGQWSCIWHGLPIRSCGLIGLTRAYAPLDRRHIIGLFEKAAAAPSSFCFSSTLLLADGQQQPVFCIGESSADDTAAGLSLSGLFLFPRFKLEGRLLNTMYAPARLA